MAQKKAQKPEKADAAPATGGGGKPWLLIGGIVLVAMGASVGGTVFLLGGSEPKTAAAASAVEAEAPPEKAVYKSLRPPFQVNFMVAQKARVLQAEMTLMARDPQALEVLDAHGPVMRARLLDLLGAQDFTALESDSGREEFRDTARGVLDKLLQEQGSTAKVEDVLLTGWVMQ